MSELKDKDVRIRDYRPEDLDWIRGRIQESAKFSIYPGRDIEASLVEAVALENFEGLLQEPEKLAILVAENPEGTRMGVLVLNLNHRSSATGETQSLIEDLDVDPLFWGTTAGPDLCRRAAQVTANHGLGYMSGFVTAGNRRTLLKSLRIGFQVERHHYIINCSDQGPIPMPGRPDDQNAHDQSRVKQRKRSRQSTRHQKEQ